MQRDNWAETVAFAGLCWHILRYARPRKPAVHVESPAAIRGVCTALGLETSSRPSRRIRRALSGSTCPPDTKTAFAVHEQPSLRYGCTKATRIADALFRCHSSWPYIAAREDTRPFPNSRFRTTEFELNLRLIFRGASEGGVFVSRVGGFRVTKPCQRPTGLSGGMPHGEGRRPSCQGGIPTRWTALCAGRQGFGRSWSRVAQIHIGEDDRIPPSLLNSKTPRSESKEVICSCTDCFFFYVSPVDRARRIW